jgi:hypothetical protein
MASIRGRFPIYSALFTLALSLTSCMSEGDLTTRFSHLQHSNLVLTRQGQESNLATLYYQYRVDDCYVRGVALNRPDGISSVAAGEGFYNNANFGKLVQPNTIPGNTDSSLEIDLTDQKAKSVDITALGVGEWTIASQRVPSTVSQCEGVIQPGQFEVEGASARLVRK